MSEAASKKAGKNREWLKHKHGSDASKDDQVEITISGAGILRVKSSDLIKSKEGRKQIDALKVLVDRGLLKRG